MSLNKIITLFEVADFEQRKKYGSQIKKSAAPPQHPAGSWPVGWKGLLWIGLFVSFVAMTKEIAPAAMSGRKAISLPSVNPWRLNRAKEIATSLSLLAMT